MIQLLFRFFRVSAFILFNLFFNKSSWDISKYYFILDDDLIEILYTLA